MPARSAPWPHEAVRALLTAATSAALLVVALTLPAPRQAGALAGPSGLSSPSLPANWFGFARAAVPWNHRVGVRQGPAGGEFYDRATGARFVPRGNNYIRLSIQEDPWTRIALPYHSTFDPGQYGPARVEQALSAMARDGYNTVRVFVNERAVAHPDGGLSAEYLSNLADFLARAKSHNVHTIIVFPLLPRTSEYRPAQLQEAFEGYNWYYLAPEAVEAKSRYLRDVVLQLAGRGAPLDYVLSYQIENEVFYRGDQAPLSWRRGQVTTADGRTYDLSDPVQRVQMMDANLVHWINRVRAAILEIDPTALVSVGFFTPRSVASSQDLRLVRTHWAIADPEAGGSTADFIDVHVYPSQQSIAEDMASLERTSRTKPVVFGEIGMSRSAAGSASAAATRLRAWQVASCRAHGVTGWLLWTWDSAEHSDYFHALESAGAINGALAPVARPDPCS